MFSILNHHIPSNELLSSKLFNESTFYDTFTKDLNDSLHEVIIESPFITYRRLAQLLPTLLTMDGMVKTPSQLFYWHNQIYTTSSMPNVRLESS